MPFSVKAQEIHAYFLITHQTDSWVAIARRYIRPKRQYRPGPAYTLNAAGLRERLKAEFAGMVADASDHDWDEIASWLFGLARPR